MAVANGTLYVADQGNASNSYVQQIVEYTVGNTKPVTTVNGLGTSSQPNAGVGLDPAEFPGVFFASDSTITAMPPAGSCLMSNAFAVAKSLMPTLWINLTLSHNQQASGLAFDSAGNMYASDRCANNVVIYNFLTWTYSGMVPGTFNAPVFLTIDNQLLAVPSASTLSGSNGYVTVIDLTGNTPTVTITNGIWDPVGAAVDY